MNSFPALKEKSIYISRIPEEGSPFKNLLADKEVKLIAEPLIKISMVNFSYTPPSQWIFFSSKNAIKYFFAQNPKVNDETKYGVISKSSGDYLAAYNKRASFIGEGVNLIQIAKSFSHELKNDSVLFPQAMDSLQTIQKQLSFSNTTYNIYTYKTTIRTDFELPYTDILIFTSPSNVDAYFQKYRVDVRQTVIAMGSTTRYRLSGYGVKHVAVPAAFSEMGLFESLVKNVG